jgi:phage-related protein
MRERFITFGGEVVPAHVASAPHIIRPARKFESVQIAGTNREIVNMEDAWECYNQTYTMYVGDGSEDSIQESLSNVARVIFKDGWQELIDDYEPDVFRLAYYTGGFDAENRFTRLGKFDIAFRCRPERFLMLGKNPVDITSGDILTNPTKNSSKPLIHIEGSGNGTLTIQGQTITITGMTDYLNIDCDKMDVYRLPNENKNSLMEGSFPVLYSGNNTITFTGGISAVSIIPKWFEI